MSFDRFPAFAISGPFFLTGIPSTNHRVYCEARSPVSLHARRPVGERMSIREELANLNPPKISKFQRWYTTWYATLDKDDQKAITDAATSELSTAKLVIFFRSQGVLVAKDAVETWRRAHGYNS